ncbi:MAG: hypothetical protein IAB19_00485 [Proteobacteria bacterium]|uniref:Uncharacterized protein n=1 Tax=Candidatus Avisuccinivibrio stercorigallinarum TaxID=2840704 RepID=A0A9D9GS99_9GAMM|nr:hypothetical protein [Candidatus Avisuccinivibrio stercorigallinarum]
MSEMTQLNKTNADSMMDILLCVDKNFLLGCGALIASILFYNKQPIRFHIFTSEPNQPYIKEQLLSRLKSNVLAASAEFLFYTYENIALYKLLKGKVNERVLIQCIRIMAPKACKTGSNNLIYLDADIICLGDLSALSRTDLQSSPIGVTVGGPRNVYGKEIKNYFISGVVVFNLKIWNNTELDRQCIEFIAEKKPKLADQDALNYFASEQAVIFPAEYQHYWEYNDETVLLHYAAGKPWAPWRYSVNIKAVNAFRRHCKLFEPDVTQWCSFKKDKQTLVNFNQFHARRAMKYLAQLFKKRKNYTAALYFYYEHYRIKVKNKGIIGTLLMRSNTRS